MRKLLLTAGLVCALAGALPSRADAQASFTPFVGATFKGDAPASKLTYGAGVTFMGKAAGLDIDFGYTPDFFNQNTQDVVIVGDNNVTTLMVSLVVGPGTGPVRPYGVFGVGLIRSAISATDLFDDVSTNDFGVNAGAGVEGKMSDHAWLRGEVRYFRSLQDPSNDGTLDVTLGKFDFWRATIGVSLR
jgi:opacity protein-like surface antigen